MSKIRHYRAGLLVDAPRNWKSTELEWVWDAQKQEGSINVSDIEFVGKEAKDVKTRIMSGLTGGVGIFEGEPYDLEFGEPGNPVFTFNGYLDFADESTFIGCNNVRTSLKKKQGNDWLNDVADAYSFRYLYDVSYITNSDFIKVPYVINYIPDNMQLLMLSISTFMLTKELVELVKSIAVAVGELIDSVTPNVGVGVTMDVGDIIWVVISVIAQVAYAIAIVIAIKNLMEQILEQLLPKKRFHKAMTVQNMFVKALGYLGYTVQSTLLEEYKDWSLIPSKSFKGGDPPSGTLELGCPTITDPTDKIGDLIRVFKEVWNADFLIVGNTFIFERVDYFQNNSTFVIPDVWDDQTLQVDVVTPNSSEVISNYNINWAYDIQDQNTLDDQTGRIYQVTLEPIVENDNKYRNLKGLKEVAIPFTMGIRKDKLTDVEKFCKQVAKLCDKLTGLFGGGTAFEAQILGRIGCLHLSSHFIALPKMVIMDGDLLATDQRGKLASKGLWNNCHFINSFVPINGKHNQWLKKKNVKIPFCEEHLMQILSNPFCTTTDGKRARIDRLKMLPYSNMAEIDYRVNEIYTLNLKNKLIE